MQITGYLAPDEFWALMRESDDRLRTSFLTAPVYGLSGWPGSAMVGEWSFGEGNRGFQYRDSTEHRPAVVVETGDAGDPRCLLAAFRRRDVFDPGSAVVAATLPDRIVEAAVDGAPVAFEVWDDADRWWGVGVIRGRAILIESRRTLGQPIALELVTDIEPLLAARNDEIRRARGE